MHSSLLKVMVRVLKLHQKSGNLIKIYQQNRDYNSSKNPMQLLASKIQEQEQIPKYHQGCFQSLLPSLIKEPDQDCTFLKIQQKHMVEDCTPVTITMKAQHSPLPYHYLKNKNRERSPYRPRLQRNSYLLEGIDHMILFIMYVINISFNNTRISVDSRKKQGIAGG